MKNMIIDSIGNIDNDMIERVDALRQKKSSRFVWIKWTAIAACLCIIMASVFAIPNFVNNHYIINDSEQKHEYSEAKYGKTFGRLFPTAILDGYELDANGIGIYGRNHEVLQANYYNETLDDMLIIRIAENDYYEGVEYGIIQYGDTKTDGSNTSQIYYEYDGYTIMYLFNRSDISEVDGFAEMVRSAPCYR